MNFQHAIHWPGRDPDDLLLAIDFCKRFAPPEWGPYPGKPIHYSDEDVARAWQLTKAVLALGRELHSMFNIWSIQDPGDFHPDEFMLFHRDLDMVEAWVWEQSKSARTLPGLPGGRPLQ